MAQDLAFAKGEVARLDKAGKNSQAEKMELQSAFEMCAKERDSIVEGEAKNRKQLEVQIKTLQKQLSGANAQFEKLLKSRDEENREFTEKQQENYTMIRQESLLLEQKLEDTIKELEITKREGEEAYKALEKTKRENRTLEEEYRHLADETSKLKETTRKSENELNSLRAVNFECSLRLKQLDEEKKRADDVSRRLEREKEELVEKFNNYGEQLQKTNSESVEGLMGKQKAKRAKLQKKIVELKGVIAKLEDDLVHHKKVISDVKASYESTITGLHEDMKRVKEEWERRVYEQDLECQRKLAEEQSRHALQISQLQEEYQQMLENKLAEIQAEAQSQITKTKTNHIEMKSLFESKMQSIEKAYVPIGKHEQIIEEERKLAKDTMEKELSALRDEYESELNKRLMNAEGAKSKELEQFSQGYRQNIQTLEENVQKARKMIETLEDKLERVEGEKEALEESGQVSAKEKKRFIEQIDDMTRQMTEMGKDMENAKQGRKEAEIHAKANKENILTLMEKYEKANSMATKLTGECESTKQKLGEVMDEKSAETRKCKGLQSEKEALQDAIRRLEDDKKQLSLKLQRQIEDLTDESQTLHANTMQMRQRESEKLEKEIKDHMATKNELQQAEAKIRQYADELAAVDVKLKDVERYNTELEEALSNSKNQVYELETKSQLMEGEMMSISQQYKELNELYSGLRGNMQKYVVEYIFGLKEEAQLLKSMLIGGISEMRKDVLKRLELAVLVGKRQEVRREKEAKEAIQREKEMMKEELHRSFESKEQEIVEQSMHVNSKYEVVIKEKNVEIKQFQSLCEEIEGKNKALFKDLTDMQNKLKTLQNEKAKLEKDNDRLKKEVKVNNEKLLNLKSEVKEQTSRLKVDAEAALSVARQELDGKYKKQLSTLQKEVETMKLDSSKELRAILGDVTNLKIQYQYETEQTIQGYEHNLGQAEYSLRVEKEKVEKYKQENERLQSEVESSKDEHKSELYQLETKMKRLNQSLMSDTEKYKKLKSEKGDEIARLSKQLREMNGDLMLKTEVNIGLNPL